MTQSDPLTDPLTADGPATERFSTGPAPAEPPVAAHAAAADRSGCPHCFGTGKILTVNDHLRASLALLGEDSDAHHWLIAGFYGRLFTACGYLALIFPQDITSGGSPQDGGGYRQRELLLAGILGLGRLYDPGNAESMDTLDRTLAQFGRSHAAFPFPDGTRPPSLEEYALVKTTRFEVLTGAPGPRRRPEFTAAWSEAYDYAYRKMGDAAWQLIQERGDLYPRQVRQ